MSRLVVSRDTEDGNGRSGRQQYTAADLKVFNSKHPPQLHPVVDGVAVTRSQAQEQSNVGEGLEEVTIWCATLPGPAAWYLGWTLCIHPNALPVIVQPLAGREDGRLWEFTDKLWNGVLDRQTGEFEPAGPFFGGSSGSDSWLRYCEKQLGATHPELPARLRISWRWEQPMPPTARQTARDAPQFPTTRVRAQTYSCTR
eukprot:COSAG01_NODE_1801_length_9200_cov_13.641358_8_plen_199_part_00